MSDELTLLPCHCGEEPCEGVSDYKVCIYCPDCGEQTDWLDNAPAAWDAWNKARQNDELRPALAAAQEALRLSGIGGIYDDFTSLADAIGQMATHIKELEARVAARDKRIAAIEATLREAVNTVRAGRRVDLADYDMRAPMVNVLTVERWASVLSSPRKEDV